MRLLKLPALTDEAAATLRPHASADDWEAIVADLEAGRAELFQCPNRTYAVLRVDGEELVIVALSGCDAVPLFQTALDIARGNRLRRVRFHTQRRGLERLLTAFGPVEVERVYRVPV
jgi:hypothetical protein